MTYGISPSRFDSLLSLTLSLSLSLSISTSLSLNISLHSLSLSSLFFSLSRIDSKKERKGPQSLLQIGGDRGPIETVDLAVGEDVS